MGVSVQVVLALQGLTAPPNLISNLIEISRTSTLTTSLHSIPDWNEGRVRTRSMWRLYCHGVQTGQDKQQDTVGGYCFYFFKGQ